jgi:hypothetical protein
MEAEKDAILQEKIEEILNITGIGPGLNIYLEAPSLSSNGWKVHKVPVPFQQHCLSETSSPAQSTDDDYLMSVSSTRTPLSDYMSASEEQSECMDVQQTYSDDIHDSDIMQALSLLDGPVVTIANTEPIQGPAFHQTVMVDQHNTQSFDGETSWSHDLDNPIIPSVVGNFQ